MKIMYQSRMRKYKVAIVLFWTFIVSSIKLELKVEAQSLFSEEEIQAKLKLLNKPAVKTIKSKDGDIIDCINIYKQPAFDHPALKNHIIQRTPMFFQESQYLSTKYDSEANIKVFQTWQKRGSCPKGTIPLRRILKNDLMRAASLNRFGLKSPTLFLNSTNTYLNSINLNGSYAVVPQSRSGAHLAASGSSYIGTQANINVWNPKIELPYDFTTSQIWLKAPNGFDFESIEAGWMVNPEFYGNNDTRFFSYWTKDSYRSTGCFDLTCSGFVQTATNVALGATIKPISSTSGQQFEFNVGIFLDESGNWWLKVNNNIPIGYWPGELFETLKHSATLIQWGGEVFSPQVKISPHTGTQMGSGDFAEGGFGHACFIRNIRIKDYSLMLKYPESINAATQEPSCYNVLNDVQSGQDPTFYFGGPGRTPPNCP